MRVVIAAVGSRGDVVPFAHLAARFGSSGHDVTLVTHRSARDLVGPAVPVVPVESDPGALLASPAARALRTGNPVELNRTRALFADFLHAAQAPTREALDGADVLVASTFAVAAVDEAVRRSVPVVRSHMWPQYPAPEGPVPLLPYAWAMPGPVRGLAQRALERAEPYLGGVDGWWERGRLHLVARHPVGLTTQTAGSLFAFSPHLLEAPPRRGRVTGWWTGPEEPPPLSSGVAEALGDGTDWICVGFGSMAQEDPTRLLEVLAAACDRLGVNAVVQVGDVRGRPHPRLLCVGEEPHDALFRHVRAVVHHGGAGTTGAVVRAGTPSVVVPHFADQYYWGGRLHALGVAARPLPRPLLGPRLLARRIETALGVQPRRSAARLADLVREEDGCGAAVRSVEDALTGTRRR